MVAGGNSYCRDYLLFRHHVLPLSKLPATIWRNAVCRMLACGRVANALLGFLLVVPLSNQLCYALYVDSWGIDHGYDTIVDP